MTKQTQITIFHMRSTVIIHIIYPLTSSVLHLCCAGRWTLYRCNLVVYRGFEVCVVPRAMAVFGTTVHCITTCMASQSLG